MSSTNHYDVKLGFWTNWSNGPIQGATVTLTRQHGGFLIAFLAIFIGMVGKSFWRLGCFALHRYFSSPEPQDGLYHQRQAILRNSDTAQDGAWRLLISMLAWRSGRRARRPILRLLPIVVAAFTISAAFGVASIFSSKVTSESLNEVLLTGTRCGSYSIEKANSVYKQLTLLLPAGAEKAIKFLNYGAQCYTNDLHTDGCNLYTKPRLPLTSTRGVPCPFGDNICKLDNDNLMMDTGMLDSLEHLGINTAPETRFQLRFVYTCAPLKTQGYMTDYNDSDYGAVKRYMYGSVANVRQVNNFTYELPVNHAYLPDDNTTSAEIPRLEYQLGSTKHYGTPNETMLAGFNRWSPIPALKLVDADVHLLYMSAPEIHYSAPVKDPWFSAQKDASELNEQDTKTKLSAWKQDEPLGVMGCTQQVQYCNPNLPENERCEPLRGVPDRRKSESVKQIFRTEDEFATIKWVDSLWVYGVYTISSTVGFIGASALRARNSLSYGFSGPLPDNQWQLEAEHLVKGSLASLQDVFVEAANGIPETLEDFRQPPLANETIAQNLCVNQKIVSNAYSSFNVLGLSLILVLGVLIVGADMGLEPMVAWWQRRRYDKHPHPVNEKECHPLYGTTEWSQTNILQLQRLAHEEAGYATWTGCDKDVPVTEPGQLLGSLVLDNIAHPILKREKEMGTPSSQCESLSPRHKESDWEEQVLPYKPWGVRRSDTGLETLVEEGTCVGMMDGKDEAEAAKEVQSGERERNDRVDMANEERAGEFQDSQPDWRRLR
ncbi:hypothetical protein BDW02DRAFT_515336 [Decorospora gaudefroyi]|uniref:Uncharacterized protein n=1 Tax=Decorospora gaudefroyi TaxID=184978 RepID=A0A6A5KUM8_9PLEO|nr:hypothetical protein BDW02DRAFT_515336 [Decorospora gaudefroyi]